MIKPTVGRIVLFWEDRDQKEPIAAIITKVIKDDLIHITAFPSMNIPHPYIDIPINRGIKQCPYAEWPKYGVTEEWKKEMKEQVRLNDPIKYETKGN